MIRNQELTGQKILIVDDDRLSAKLLEKLLQRNGYTTFSASRGKDCVQLTHQHRPDVILLDIMMPDIDGITVCRSVRRSPEIAATPIIFITAATDDLILGQAFDAGGNDYVRKPVNSKELLKRIQAALYHKLLTEKHKEEEKLQSALSMGGTICHELNQPLQYLSGMAQILLMDLEKGSKPHNTVVKMQEQIKRMAELTNKLTSINNVETRNYVGDTRIIKLGN